MTDRAPTPRPNAPSGELERALLPWESAEAFRALAASYHAAYLPDGPVEAELLDQLLWLSWRRRRLRLSERALHIQSAARRTSEETADALVERALVHAPSRAVEVDAREALQTAEADDPADAVDAADDLAMTRAALKRLEEGGETAYRDALALLREDTRAMWQDVFGEGGDAETLATDLAAYLTSEIVPLCERIIAGVAHRPEIRLQAIGESLDPDRMGTLLVLDERLTRQFEKTLGMLIRLQEMRGQGRG